MTWAVALLKIGGIKEQDKAVASPRKHFNLLNEIGRPVIGPVMPVLTGKRHRKAESQCARR